MDGIDAIFGLHVWPFLPSGTLGSRAGALMGACQQFQVTIKGRGGHAAMPHTVIDPIVASSHVILALQVTPSNAQSLRMAWCDMPGMRRQPQQGTSQPGDLLSQLGDVHSHGP